MTKSFADIIGQATHLTRSGKLTEATALIQSRLSGRAAPIPDDAIDGTFTRLNEPEVPPRKPSAQRTKLSETLRKIAAGGMPASGFGGTKDATLPQGAEFRSLTHVGPHGTRTYRLYLPANRAARMPLVIMLHGCTQTPEDFAAGTAMNVLAEEFGCVIAYPGQPSGANAQKCWNWYRPEDQASGTGEPAVIAGLTRDILRDFAIDPASVFVAGLSAGGAAALITGCAYPEIFSAIGVHSGLAVGAAQDVPSAFAAMRNGARGKTIAKAVPTIVFHGLADSTVKPDNGRAVIDQMVGRVAGVRKSTEFVKSSGMRQAKRTQYRTSTDRTIAELWEVEGAGHAWSGGSAAGSYTDPTGPDASRHMLRFFLDHGKV